MSATKVKVHFTVDKKVLSELRSRGESNLSGLVQRLLSRYLGRIDKETPKHHGQQMERTVLESAADGNVFERLRCLKCDKEEVRQITY